MWHHTFARNSEADCLHVPLVVRLWQQLKWDVLACALYTHMDMCTPVHVHTGVGADGGRSMGGHRRVLLYSYGRSMGGHRRAPPYGSK